MSIDAERVVATHIPGAALRSMPGLSKMENKIDRILDIKPSTALPNLYFSFIPGITPCKVKLFKRDFAVFKMDLNSDSDHY